MPERRILPWALGLGLSLFYLLFPSAFYNFDGVACAIAVELSDFPHLVHGNHLAYGLLGWLFDRFWRILGYAGPAILPLQALDSLLGAAGAGVFCALLLRLGLGPQAACLASLGLALSQAYWFWSLEAQVYMLGSLFLMLAALEGFGARRPVRLGLWHALAMLGHVGHALFLPVAVYLLWNARDRGKLLGRYGLALVLTVLCAYGAVAALVVRPGTLEAWRLWLLGSSALGVERSFAWHGGLSWANLGQWGLMTLRIFTDPLPLPGPARLAGWCLSGAALACAAASPFLAPSGLGKAVRAALIWIASYALLYASWEPWTAVYRITDLAPLWLLIACLVSSQAGHASRSLRRALGLLMAAWLAAAGLFNWKTTIAPRADPANNRQYQEALWIAAKTPPESWVVVSSVDQVYIPYFALRKPLNMRYFEGRQEALRLRLDLLAAAGQKVFITSGTLKASGLRDFFKAYGLREQARRGETVLWRLAPLKKRESRGGAG